MNSCRHTVISLMYSTSGFRVHTYHSHRLQCNLQQCAKYRVINMNRDYYYCIMVNMLHYIRTTVHCVKRDDYEYEVGT